MWKTYYHQNLSMPLTSSDHNCYKWFFHQLISKNYKGLGYCLYTFICVSTLYMCYCNVRDVVGYVYHLVLFDVRDITWISGEIIVLKLLWYEMSFFTVIRFISIFCSLCVMDNISWLDKLTWHWKTSRGIVQYFTLKNSMDIMTIFLTFSFVG